MTETRSEARARRDLPRAAVPGKPSLLAVLAHPDDETLGVGGTLARYAAEGVRTHVLTATRGQAGRHGPGPHPGEEALGWIRECELRRAAGDLGVRTVRVLGHMDGALDRVEPETVVGEIAGHVRRIRPQVVLTFGPDGGYGHPDHIAISQLTTAAVTRAADHGWEDGAAPHAVSKLYYMAWSGAAWDAYQRAFKTLTSTVGGVVRHATPWPDWAITTRIDARPWWRTVWRAVHRHETQMSVYAGLERLTKEEHERLWGDQTFYRVMSTVNGGREVERDLFEGLRAPERVEVGAGGDADGLDPAGRRPGVVGAGR